MKKKFKNRSSVKAYWIIPIFLTLIFGCKKFIEVNPPTTSINGDNVYNDNSNARAVLTGIYTKMSSSYFSLYLSVLPEFSSDNLTLFNLDNPFASSYYQNSLNSLNENAVVVFWNDLYSYIYISNAAIEGLSKSTSLTPAIKDRLLGEAYFLRAFYYFYLINLYGEVPLLTSTDYSKNSVEGNTPITTTYNQIIADLKLSQSLLSDSYVDATIVTATVERLRPNALAASALLARVYLYNKNYNEAQLEATKVISKTNLYSLGDVEMTFLKNSSETIWSLQPVTSNLNTLEGDFFIYSDEGPNSINYSYLSPSLLKSFEKGDLRKSTWIKEFKQGNETYPYPFKYQVKNGDPSTAVEYTVVLRLAEQYLIRAEARIQQGDIIGGIQDLNSIRTRSRASATTETPDPLPNLSPNVTKVVALDYVLNERRFELFTEWGNRWLDLKRTGKIDGVMGIETPLKGGNWQNFKSLYPIPRSEIRANPNLNQNPGYN